MIYSEIETNQSFKSALSLQLKTAIRKIIVEVNELDLVEQFISVSTYQFVVI